MYHKVTLVKKLMCSILLLSLLGMAQAGAAEIDWIKAVYWDADYPSGWAGGGEGMRDALADAGYEVLDAEQLKSWMDARIADKERSVVVFAKDIAPDTVAESQSDSATIRRYLDAGGKIVWYSDIPFYYQGHADGSSETWADAGAPAILGFNTSPGGLRDSGNLVTFTPAGESWGLTQTWNSARPATADAADGLTVLATDNAGNAAAWVKSYVANDSSRGFVRFWDTAGDTPPAEDVIALAEYISLIASNPTPADGAEGLGTPVFEWTAGDTALLHNVYFGTDPNLTEADLVAGDQSFELYFHPLPLEPGTTYYWRVDEIDADGNIYTGDLWQFTVSPMEAWDASPEPGQPNVVLDTELSWQPGLEALSHDVYFATDEAAVAAGDASTFVGNLAETTYAPETLTEDMTYYWRVDEVAADGAVTPGTVWSFTTVPSIAISDPNLLGWWTFDAGAGDTAVDWSGQGNHGQIRGGAEWVEGYANLALNFDGADNFVFIGKDAGELGIEGAEPKSVTAWVYTRAFNNGGIFDMGARADGQDFSLRTLGSANQWRTQHWGAAADHDFTFDAQDEWAHMALVYDGITSAVYVNGNLITSNAVELNTATSNPFQIGAYGWQESYFDGLIDDVRLYDKALTEDELNLVMRIDPLLAWDPSPMNGELTDVVEASTLTWEAGDMADQHDVYLGTDRTAVAGANTADDVYQGQVGATSFSPAEPIAWDQQYYWRVDEVNTDGSVTKGLIWSFATADYLIVENFESYNDVQDDGGNAVFLTWIDGFGDDTNGSVVGYIDPANGTFNETSDVHTGGQAMPFQYNNVTAEFSEATRELSPAEDWTLDDLTDLTIWYKGAPVDFVETADGITMSASGADIWNMADEFRYAYDDLTGDATITAKVDSLVDTDPWAKAGVMIRETLEPGSKHAYVVATPGNGVSFGWRQFTADTSGSSTVGGIEVPVWVKLTRSGDTFTAQYSTDGVVWEDFADADGAPVATEITMTSNVTAGLALTSHNAGAVTTAEFSNVEIDGAPRQWQVAEVGVDHPGNSPDQLYVTVEDASGGSATVVHPDGPSAVNVSDWTDWKISLADLSGVNLSQVGSLTLGVGNTDMEGTGTLLFDDIRVTKPEPVVEDPNEVVVD